MENILEIKDVSYVYGGGTPFEMVALNHVSVGFEKGKITGVIGHTGSGKSTLVQLLNGLLRPQSGEILLNGESIWAKPKEIQKIRYRVGLVMQYPEYQLFDETVRADIGYAPRNMGLSPEEVEARVKEAAAFVRLDEELLDQSPFALSGGQKRRAAIAGIIAMRPEVLVLDEPAAGLDPLGRSDILGGLREYQRSCNATVILVSHSMEDMAQYCDRIVALNHAEVFLTGTVDEVFSRSKELAEVGLDIPHIARFALALQKRGVPLEGSLYTVSGVAEAYMRALQRKKAASTAPQSAGEGDHA
ncbi:MAG: energy-coupling factor transporter ATPase [Clostridia bacterium]|nr:energy-coupling factor transporter ATPase [Clostridia bacterium]